MPQPGDRAHTVPTLPDWTPRRVCSTGAGPHGPDDERRGADGGGFAGELASGDRAGVEQGAALRAALLGMLPGPEETVPDPERAEAGYVPSAGLQRLVRLRDPLCTGLGCSTSSRRCDLDHETPWPAGPTSAADLRPRSRRCHRAKTISWRVRTLPDGSTRWTSPSRRTYTVPPAWEPPPPLTRSRHEQPAPADQRPQADDDSGRALAEELARSQADLARRTPPRPPRPGPERLVHDEPPPF